MAISFEPVAEWLLVQRASVPQTKIINGIVVPDSSLKAIPKAMVLGIGTKVPLDVHPGDEIVLNQYSGEDIDFGGQILTFVRWDEIKCVIRFVSDPEPPPREPTREEIKIEKRKAKRKCDPSLATTPTS